MADQATQIDANDPQTQKILSVLSQVDQLKTNNILTQDIKDRQQNSQKSKLFFYAGLVIVAFFAYKLIKKGKL